MLRRVSELHLAGMESQSVIHQVVRAEVVAGTLRVVRTERSDSDSEVLVSRELEYGPGGWVSVEYLTPTIVVTHSSMRSQPEKRLATVPGVELDSMGETVSGLMAEHGMVIDHHKVDECVNDLLRTNVAQYSSVSGSWYYLRLVYV